jgi:ammonium transporter, Amt family
MNISNTTTPAFVSNPADTTFLFTATCLVFIMTPGLGFFYSGLVRQKNAAATIFLSVITIVIVGIQWYFIGFSLAFANGGPVGYFIGGYDFFMLIDNKLSTISKKKTFLTIGHPNAPTVSIYMFFLYQLMFAGITPALITGGMAERLRFRFQDSFLIL